MKRDVILFILVGIVSTVKCKVWSRLENENQQRVGSNEPVNANGTSSPLASVTPPAHSDMQTLLTYSADPVQLGQTVNFTCTTNSGSAFANSSKVFLSAWLYVHASDSQTQVAFGSATSTANSQSVPCVTLASLSGRAVQCTFSATEIVFSLSNVIVSDEKVYGCQVFTSTNAAYSVWWATSLRVYAPAQQPVMYFTPSNPIQTGQYLQSVTCVGNVGNPNHQISLFYQPAAKPNKVYLVTSTPSISREINADGTTTASYTFNLPGSQCQYEWINNNNGSAYQQYTCQNIGGSINLVNNGDVYSCVINSSETSIYSYSTNTSEALDVQYGVQSPEVNVNASTLVNNYNNYEYNYNLYSSSYNISVNDCVTLTCSSSGNPAPTVLWIQLSSKANQSLAMSNFVRDKFTTYAVATGYFEYPDLLTFVCFISNTGGSGSSTFTSAYYKAVHITVHSETSNEYMSRTNRCDFSAGSENDASFGGTVKECSSASTTQFVSPAINSTSASDERTSSVIHNSFVELPKSTNALAKANQKTFDNFHSSETVSDYGIKPVSNANELRKQAIREIMDLGKPASPIKTVQDKNQAMEEKAEGFKHFSETKPEINQKIPFIVSRVPRKQDNERNEEMNYYTDEPSNSLKKAGRADSTVEFSSTSATSATSSFATNDFTFPDSAATQACDKSVSLFSDYYKLLVLLAAFVSGATASGIAVFVLTKKPARKAQNAAIFECGQETAKLQVAEVQEPSGESLMKENEDHYFCHDETSPILE